MPGYEKYIKILAPLQITFVGNLISSVFELNYNHNLTVGEVTYITLPKYAYSSFFIFLVSQLIIVSEKNLC